MLQVQELSFSFKKTGGGDLPVIQGLTLEFPQGKVTSLVGPSGCGKSTLLNIIAGLLEPTSGKVSYSQSDRRVGYVFQAASLVPWRTVWKNALLGAEIAGLGESSVADRARHLLASYGLGDFEQIYPARLSGGMQQRVALVRAILAGTKILLLDEPFSGSDYLMRRGLQADLARAVEEEQLIAILVTHDLEEAVLLGNKVVILTGRPAKAKAEIQVSVDRKKRFEGSWSIGRELMPYLEKVWAEIE